MAEPLRWDMTLPNGEKLRWDMGPEYRWDGSVPNSAYPPNTMSLPNVAIAFPQTTRDDIKAAINSLKALFPVLAPVSPDDLSSLQTVAEGREPYIADAYQDAKDNPTTVPGTVNMTTWGLLEEQFAGLDDAETELLGLLELVQGVKAIAGDQRYKCTRKYYDYLGGNLDALAGAKVIHDKIAKLFAKQGPSKKAATPKPNP
jgi:hypothetical protein